jgi:hypothetical protein
MKSDWLPAMPLHVAIWSQIIMETDLSWADQGKTIRLLANAWSRGDVGDRPQWAGNAAWDAFCRMWPETMRHRQKAVASAEKNAAKAKLAADARWNAPGNAPNIPPDDAPSMLQASDEHASSTAQSKDPNPNPNPNQDPNQNPDPTSLRSVAARRQAPPDFTLTRERFEYAVEKGLTIEDVGEEFEQFLDHRYRSPRTKWDLAWKAWVRKAVQIRGLGVSRRAGTLTAAEQTKANAESALRRLGAL